MRAVAPPVVYGSRFVALRRSSGRHKWRPYVCGRLNAVFRRPVCGVARGGAIHDARCRNGTCGRSRCVSVDAGGASVGLSFCGGWFAALRRSSGRHKWRPYVCGRLNAVSRRSSGCHGWRPYVCGWLIVVSRVVECCFAGGCWRRNGGCRGKGMGMKKRSRTDVAVSVWLLVVAEARLERTTSRL